MIYEEVKYSRSSIEKAGKVIAKYEESSLEFQEYLPVIDNWRAAHAYPMDVITEIINEVVCRNNGVHLVKRLKRLDSIIGKLQRANNTGLYRMQDLGGCRVIVPDIKGLYSIVNDIKSEILNSGHEIKKEYDYINKPRTNSGYRSYHIVVALNNKGTKFDGMLIEIQIRTLQEHQWATSVEIMDSIANETLKIGTGNPEYMYFFKLVSALFSIEENTNVVDGVCSDKAEIVKELYKIDKEESIREKIAAYNSAIKFSGKYPDNADYFLLITDMRTGTIRTSAFRREEIDIAVEEYQRLERERKNNGIDVVLVAATDFDTIKECYPNYFMETLAFLKRISELCVEYPEETSIPHFIINSGVKIKEIFNVKYNKANIKSGNATMLGGIGNAYGTTIFCPGWPFSLDDSYLRFSGIRIKASDINLNEEEPCVVTFPGIVCQKTGACFFVDLANWEYYSETDSLVIQVKDRSNIDWLIYFLGWIKSNIFLWDLLWNKHANSLCRKTVIENLLFPQIGEKEFEHVCSVVRSVLNEEENFVNAVNSADFNNSIDIDEAINTFNNNQLKYLRINEKIFGEYYRLNDDERKIIGKELEMKGYFSYDKK